MRRPVLNVRLNESSQIHEGVIMDDNRVPEDQITPILPFRNPSNSTETNLNALALKLYNDPIARMECKNTSAWALHPHERGHVYFTSVGWTSEGWRTFTTVSDLEGLLGFADTTVKFMDKAFAVNDAAEKVEAGMPLGRAAMEMLIDKANSESCGNPDCPVHGTDAGKNLEALSKLLGEMFGM